MLFRVFCVCIQDQGSNNFENDIINLSVNKAKLTGLWARNWATIQQILILKFAFGPEKFPGLLRNGPLVPGPVPHLYYKVGYRFTVMPDCQAYSHRFH